MSPALREGSSLQHRPGQGCQSPEVSGAVLGDQAGPWMGTHPCTATHTCTVGGCALILGRWRPDPAAPRWQLLAPSLSSSGKRHWTGWQSRSELPQAQHGRGQHQGSGTDQGDKQSPQGHGTLDCKDCTNHGADGWMDGQTELSSLHGSHSLFLSSWGCAPGSSKDPIRCSPPRAGGSPASTGRWSGGSAAAPGPRAWCAGWHGSTCLGKGTWPSGLSPALGSCQHSLPAPSHCTPELLQRERSPPHAPAALVLHHSPTLPDQTHLLQRSKHSGASHTWSPTAHQFQHLLSRGHFAASSRIPNSVSGGGCTSCADGETSSSGAPGRPRRCGRPWQRPAGWAPPASPG